MQDKKLVRSQFNSSDNFIAKAKDIGAVAAYVAIVLFFFRPVISHSKNIIYPVDTIDMIFTKFSFIARWVHQGVIPLWDPY